MWRQGTRNRVIFLLYFDLDTGYHLGTHCLQRLSQLEEVKLRPAERVPSQELASSRRQNLLQVGLDGYNVHICFLNIKISIFRYLYQGVGDGFLDNFLCFLGLDLLVLFKECSVLQNVNNNISMISFISVPP